MLDDAYINELVKKSAEFGNGKIHIIINNAGFTWDGVIHKASQPLEQLLTQRSQAMALILMFTDNRQAMGHNHRPA